MPKTRPSVHEIRQPRRNIWLATGLIVLVALGLLAGAYGNTGQGRLLPVILALAVAAFAILVNRAMSAEVVRLTPTQIEKVGLFGRKSLPLADIIGARSGPEVLLITRGGKAAMALPFYARRSPAILGWVQGLDNLTDVEAFEAQAVLETDDRLGSGPAARADTVVAMRRLASGLSLLAVGICVWGVLDPRPYDLVMGAGAVLPLCALILVAARPGVFTLGARRGLEAHPGLLGLIALPTGLFVLRAMRDVQLSPWWGPALAAALIGIGLAVVIRRIDPLSRDRATLGLHVLLLIPLVWGVLSIANVRLDRGPAEVIPVTVIAADDPDTPEVTVRLPAASGGREMTLEASDAIARAAGQGHALCLVVRHGAFGWRSLYPVDCTPVPPVTPRRTGPSVVGPTPGP